MARLAGLPNGTLVKCDGHLYEVHRYCAHCRVAGHWIEKCWHHNPDLKPKSLRQLEAVSAEVILDPVSLPSFSVRGSQPQPQDAEVAPSPISASSAEDTGSCNSSTTAVSTSPATESPPAIDKHKSVSEAGAKPSNNIAAPGQAPSAPHRAPGLAASRLAPPRAAVSTSAPVHLPTPVGRRTRQPAKPSSSIPAQRHEQPRESHPPEQVRKGKSTRSQRRARAKGRFQAQQHHQQYQHRSSGMSGSTDIAPQASSSDSDFKERAARLREAYAASAAATDRKPAPSPAIISIADSGVASSSKSPLRGRLTPVIQCSILRSSVLVVPPPPHSADIRPRVARVFSHHQQPASRAAPPPAPSPPLRPGAMRRQSHVRAPSPVDDDDVVVAPVVVVEPPLPPPPPPAAKNVPRAALASALARRRMKAVTAASGKEEDCLIDLAED